MGELKNPVVGQVRRIGRTVLVEIEGADPRGINDDVSDEQLQRDIIRAQAVLARRAQERAGTVAPERPAVAQVAREFIKANPGCSTDDLVRGCQVDTGQRKAWVLAVARQSRSHLFGMLGDGRWFITDANQEIDADIRHARTSQGVERLMAYYDTPMSRMDPELGEWGIRHA